MKVGQFDICPVCKFVLGQENQFQIRECPNCNTLIPPRMGQGYAVRLDHGMLESNRDDLGFINPNLHRRIIYCECMELNSWICPVHKDVGVCNCEPYVIPCECGVRNRSNETYKVSINGIQSYLETSIKIRDEDSVISEIP